MYFRYGTYQHAFCEVQPQIVRSVLYTQVGINQVAYGFRDTWTLSGFLQADNPADLTAALQALDAAYLIPNQSFGLYYQDGTPSFHVVDAVTALAVRVKQRPSFLRGSGEGGTFRSYEIVLEVDFGTQEGAIVPLTYQEQMDFTGGGPQFIYLQPIEGDPIKQYVSQNTPYVIIQSGIATQYSFYPPPPPPFWPEAEHQELRKIQKISPNTAPGSGIQIYTTRWHYTFEAVEPLYADPHQGGF